MAPKREQGEKLISDWKNTRELNELWNIEAYCGERVKCYNCGRNGHRASDCDRPTKAQNAGRRNPHQNKQVGSIPPDFFDQGSYIKGVGGVKSHLFFSLHFYPAEFTPDGVLSSAYSYVRTYVRTSQKFLISNDIFGFLGPSHQ